MDSKAVISDVRQPEYFLNRELSLLAFNRRVLAQARDESVPLLERLVYLCISSLNLDEFFEIRVAGLKELQAVGSVQTEADGLSPTEVLERISQQAHQLVDDQYETMNRDLFPALEEQGICFLRRDEWSEEQAAWVEQYFRKEVLPVLTPMGLDPAHPFPRVLNKSLHFIVTLEGKDAFGRSSGLAVVQAPRSLPRVIPVPTRLARQPYVYIFLSSIIHAHMDELFPGMTVAGSYQFRVTRNSDLFVDDEESSNLLRALEGELQSRRFGSAVRLEVAENCSNKAIKYLLDVFGLQDSDLYKVNGPVNLSRLQEVHALIDRPDLKFSSYTPDLPAHLGSGHNLFETISAGDVLLHHPFQSFAPVVDLLRQAAADKKVLAIKQTLYRTGPDSVIVDSLVEAARGGKEVTVVIELRARFDEEDNIKLANRLHEAGAHVAYGVVGYKTHAKMALIVRREGRRLKRYVHLGTGNYHSRTARIYTDYGLMTCDPTITEDVHKVFQQLTGLGRAIKLKRIWQSPFTLCKNLLAAIQNEVALAKAGKPARIIAKMNALTEPTIIEALYKASQAGVQIDLIIRGICCLRPGVVGVSENIKVRSIIGRYLEHTRIFYFKADGDNRVYCSSADWMDRNLFRRVETCFPILDRKLADQVIKQGLMTYLADNRQAWLMDGDGNYKLRRRGSGKAKIAQQHLMEVLGR